MDIFHEYIVTKKKEAKDYVITLLLIAAATFLTFVLALLTMMYSQYLSSIGLLLIVGAWWGAVYLIKLPQDVQENVCAQSILRKLSFVQV